MKDKKVWWRLVMSDGCIRECSCIRTLQKVLTPNGGFIYRVTLS